MPRAANRGPEPGEDLVRAVTPLDREIRGLCVKLGLRVDLLDALAKDSSDLPLPWSATSRERAREASKILKNPPAKNLSSPAIEHHLSDIIDPTRTTFPGLIGAVMAVENNAWSDSGKAAFAFSLSTGHVTGIETALILASSEDDKRLVCEAASAWIIYETLCASTLSRCNVSPAANQVMTALQDYSLRTIGTIYYRHLQEGTWVDNHPWSKLEEILLTVAQHNPHSGTEIQRILPVLRSALSDEPEGADPILASELQSILESPNVDLRHGNIEGKEVGEVAREYQKNVERNLAMAKHFIPLVDQDEWSNPLTCLAKLADTSLVQSIFLTHSFWANEKVIEIMCSTLSHMETKPHIVISSSDIGLVSSESSSVVEIVDGIQSYLRTGQRSYAEFGTVAPAQRESLKSLLDFLDQMRDHIGAERIHVVVGNELAEYLRQRPVKGFLFASGERGVSPQTSVTFDLSGRSEVDHDHLARIRERLKKLQHSMPSIAAVEIDLFARELVPFLASTRGGADPLGLVGYKPTTALRLANETLLSEPLSFTPPQVPQSLRVTLVREQQEEAQGDPADFTKTDLPLQPIGGDRS